MAEPPPSAQDMPPPPLRPDEDSLVPFGPAPPGELDAPLQAGSGPNGEAPDIPSELGLRRGEGARGVNDSVQTMIAGLLALLRQEGGAAPAVDSPAPSPFSDIADSKYLIEGEIGRGGMGRVFLAFDRNVRRRVAIKVLQSHLARDRVHLARFIEEAQITGQLEHPGIPPIHEIGVGTSGDVYFTMKLVRGRTLKEILRDLHIGRRDVRERYTTKRLLGILQAVCNAVHFAHEKGVVHRDIKPDNIMVGDYGEVQLMDWGLAKVVGARPDSDGGEEPVDTLRTESGVASVAGFVHGTLHYMAPEQAQGRNDLVDPRSDVYALGATMYEILTYQRALTGETVADLLEESRLGLIAAPRERAPKLKIPLALEEICMKALEYHPDDRYQSALELANDMQVFLEGTLEDERRKREVDRLLVEARKVLREHDQTKRALQATIREAEDLRQALMRSFSRPEDWRREREIFSRMEEKSIAVATQFTRAQTLLSSALGSDPENAVLKRLLGDLYLDRFLQADREGNQADLIFYRGLIQQVSDGSHDKVLQGDGALAIETTPGGAAMVLQAYRESDGVLSMDVEVWRGTGPLSLSRLPMGSYLLTITREGCAPARFPVLVRRNQEVRAMVKLYPAESVPDGLAYVPEGAFLFGGNPGAFWLDREPKLGSAQGFAMSIHPVTCGEYREFLDDFAQSDSEEAHRRSPRESEHSGHYWQRGEDGRFGYPADSRYPWSDRLPLFGVSFEDALVFCHWRSVRDGFRYDLPSEMEWEKAARGVDGRLFAWGNYFDQTLCNSHFSRPERPGVATVDEFPRDESPYGVRGLTGNVGDLCYDAFDARQGVACLRGGNWALTGPSCRLAIRRQVPSTYVSDRIGFRLKLDLR